MPEPAERPSENMPRVVAGFELLGRLGEGSMGRVYKARQLSMDRLVALKILPLAAAKDSKYIERFQREARASAQLNHANIVQAIDAGRDPQSGLWYFAMEWVDGPTVKRVLSEEKALAETRALKIVRDIASALECAAAHKIIHRDIKPDNILLTSRGVAKLSDLGLAKRLTDDAFLTRAGQTVGTPHYMAPEQVRGRAAEIDTLSDIYALGATLFHLVTGRVPYEGETAAVVMAQHLTAPPPNARQVNPRVSLACATLIEQMMQKDRAKRIQTPAQVVATIDHILARSAAAEPQAEAEPARVSKLHWAWLVFAGVVIVLVGAMVFSLMPPRAAPPVPNRGEGPGETGATVKTPLPLPPPARGGEKDVAPATVADPGATKPSEVKTEPLAASTTPVPPPTAVAVIEKPAPVTEVAKPLPPPPAEMQAVQPDQPPGEIKTAAVEPLPQNHAAPETSLPVPGTGNTNSLPPTASFLAEYGPPDFTHPDITRREVEVGSNWQKDPPGAGLGLTRFGAVYSGWLTPPADAAYVFSIEVNDGLCFWLDDILLYDSGNRFGTFQADLPPLNLKGGKHYVMRAEYRSGTSEASLNLAWQSPAMPRCALTGLLPDAVRADAKDIGHLDGALLAEYHTVRNVTLKQLEGRLEHDFGTSGPKREMTGGFSGRWTGRLKAPAAGPFGQYMLRLEVEGSGQVLLNGIAAIKVPAGGARPGGVESPPIPLAKGTLYDLEVSLEVRRGEKSSRLRLTWKPPGKKEFEDIPAEAFVLKPGAREAVQAAKTEAKAGHK